MNGVPYKSVFYTRLGNLNCAYLLKLRTMIGLLSRAFLMMQNTSRGAGKYRYEGLRESEREREAEGAGNIVGS